MTAQTNEAAERLRPCSLCGCAYDHKKHDRTERRATVERIRLEAVGPDDKTHDRIIFVDDLERILDKEAAR